MREDFLHYLWKYKKFRTAELFTTQNEPLKVFNVGEHNYHSGPDFFNARVVIGEQLWAGNIEMHIKSSDWYVHGHETDPAYENVILHIVWEHDLDVFRKDNTLIPTLVLKDCVDNGLIQKYKSLMTTSSTWIPCEKEFGSLDDFAINNWLERLYLERLERKCDEVTRLLTKHQNNWEYVFMLQLARTFGLKTNGEAFASIVQSLPWKVLLKLASQELEMEALLFGQAGLLGETMEEPYYLQLQKKYQYLQHKYKLKNAGVLAVQFHRLRPSNFPTIRLAQLAAIYHEHINLFSKVMALKTKEEAYEFFAVSVTSFWENHYTFKTASKISSKVPTKSFIDLLLINAIIPIKYAFAKYQGQSMDEELLELALGISAEQNSIVEKFQSLKQLPKSGLHSQALLQLKTNYCDKRKCLECVVGNTLLKMK